MPHFMPQKKGADTLPIPLPVRLETLKISVQWTSTAIGVFLPGEWPRQDITVSSFDPWVMRAEYQQLPEGDNEAALEFLNRYGFYQKPDVESALLNAQFLTDVIGPEEVTEMLDKHRVIRTPYGSHVIHGGGVPLFAHEQFWLDRRRVVTELKQLSNPTSPQYDAQLVDAHGRREPSIVITVLSIMDALRATIQIDRLCKAEIRRCKRWDCEVLFAVSPTNKRKIYHDYYCAHIEQVRDSRRPRKARRKK